METELQPQSEYQTESDLSGYESELSTSRTRGIYSTTLSLLGGAGVGAALMYLFDPDTGQRHRRNLSRRTMGFYKSSQAAGQNLMERARDTRHNLAERFQEYRYNRNLLPRRFARQSYTAQTAFPFLKALSFSAIGAGVALLLDPVGGARRRSLIRDKFVRYYHRGGDAVGDTGRYLQGQLYGLSAMIRRLFNREAEVADPKLIARVRSVLGRSVSHPHAIRVTSQQGLVTLSGPVLAHEIDNLLRHVRRVRGVTEIDNRLEVHESPENVPGLQGQNFRQGRQIGVMQQYWSPTTRLVAGATGCSLCLYGLGRRDLTGIGLSLLGAGLLARASTNLPFKRITGISAGRRAIDVQKTANINAPIEDVYRFFSNPENFPHFTRNVREVRDLGGGRSHWVVAGPVGMPVEWDCVITDCVPNEIIAWKTEPGSTVAHAGVIRFQRNEDGGTRVDIKMSYNPPAGAIGHTVATLFGADPKREMDQDLVRIKTMLETGNAPHDAAQPFMTSR